MIPDTIRTVVFTGGNACGDGGLEGVRVCGVEDITIQTVTGRRGSHKTCQTCIFYWSRPSAESSDHNLVVILFLPVASSRVSFFLRTRAAELGTSSFSIAKTVLFRNPCVCLSYECNAVFLSSLSILAFFQSLGSGRGGWLPAVQGKRTARNPEPVRRVQGRPRLSARCRPPWPGPAPLQGRRLR